MKAFFIYNQHSALERNIIERAKQEMFTYVDEFIVMNMDEAKEKFHIRATPALIIIRDDLQGEHLIGEGVDGQLLATAMLYKQLEEEELIVHEQETHRLDNMIKAEKQAAEDALLLDMLERGIV